MWEGACVADVILAKCCIGPHVDEDAGHWGGELAELVVVELERGDVCDFCGHFIFDGVIYSILKLL